MLEKGGVLTSHETDDYVKPQKECLKWIMLNKWYSAENKRK